MGKRIKKLKKIRLHREGTDQLLYGGIGIALVAAILWFALTTKIPFWAFLVIMVPIYCIVLNFYRCPIRYLNIEDTEHIVVAPADGKIVVIEEVEDGAAERGRAAAPRDGAPEGVADGAERDEAVEQEDGAGGGAELGGVEHRQHGAGLHLDGTGGRIASAEARLAPPRSLPDQDAAVDHRISPLTGCNAGRN